MLAGIVRKMSLDDEVLAIIKKYPDTAETLSIAMSMVHDFGEWYVDALDMVDDLELQVKALETKLSAKTERE